MKEFMQDGVALILRILLGEQLLVGRVVQVNAEVVGHLELHRAHRIPRPRQLAHQHRAPALRGRDLGPVDRLRIDDAGVRPPI
jgi:hypothetical protein